MRTAAIVNPRAASGKAAKMWQRVSGSLGDVETRLTQYPNHATALARELLGEGYERILAVGGDGTINEVVNGWFDQDRALRPQAVLAVVPMGTGGDFRRSLGLAGVDAALQVIREGDAQSIDVGKVTYRAHDGSTRTRYFANLVSFGMGGEVAERSKNWLSTTSGKMAFLWATLDVFFRYQAKTVELEIDGAPAGTHTVTNIAIGNGRYHGGGMHVCPRADLRDGLLEVTVIDALGMLVLAKDIGVLYSDNVYKHPKVHHFHARKVTARSRESVSIEVDGEALGTLPLEITLLPGALRIQTAPITPS